MSTPQLSFEYFDPIECHGLHNGIDSWWNSIKAYQTYFLVTTISFHKHEMSTAEGNAGENDWNFINWKKKNVWRKINSYRYRYYRYVTFIFDKFILITFAGFFLLLIHFLLVFVFISMFNPYVIRFFIRNRGHIRNSQLYCEISLVEFYCCLTYMYLSIHFTIPSEIGDPP